MREVSAGSTLTVSVPGTPLLRKLLQRRTALNTAFYEYGNQDGGRCGFRDRFGFVTVFMMGEHYGTTVMSSGERTTISGWSL